MNEPITTWVDPTTILDGQSLEVELTACCGESVCKQIGIRNQGKESVTAAAVAGDLVPALGGRAFDAWNLRLRLTDGPHLTALPDSFDVEAGGARVILFTVCVPPDTQPALYGGHVRLRMNEQTYLVHVTLRGIDIKLPELDQVDLDELGSRYGVSGFVRHCLATEKETLEGQVAHSELESLRLLKLLEESTRPR